MCMYIHIHLASLNSPAKSDSLDPALVVSKAKGLRALIYSCLFREPKQEPVEGGPRLCEPGEPKGGFRGAFRRPV